MEKTKVYLNTWGAYNNGSIGYGWMDAAEAIDFIEANPERDGGEWFVADIDNYLGVDFGNLDYCDVVEVCESIQALEEMDEDEIKAVVAIMEYNGGTVQEAIDKMDDFIIYADVDQYFDSCDELLDFSGCNDILERYFDYESYHRDCMFDAYEAGNGVVLVA